MYVSSDHDVASMRAYMTKHPEWLAVDYSDPIRNELKRKFGCCAGSEQSAVGVAERKYGIPALVIVEPDGSVIKESGVADVESFKGGNDIPDSWRPKIT